MILWHFKANDISGDEEQWGLTHETHGHHGSVNWAKAYVGLNLFTLSVLIINFKRKIKAAITKLLFVIFIYCFLEKYHLILKIISW